MLGYGLVSGFIGAYEGDAIARMYLFELSHLMLLALFLYRLAI